MNTQYHVVSEYDRLNELLKPAHRRIEIDRRIFDRADSAVAFAKTLPCDIYAEPLDGADGIAEYTILHTVYRVDLDYDGFPVDNVLIGCRRLPEDQLPDAVKAYHNGRSGKKYKGRWFPVLPMCQVPQHGNGSNTESIDLIVRLSAAEFQKLSMIASARGVSPEEAALAILQRELINNDPEEWPDTKAIQPDPNTADSGMGQDWEE